jgi:very-short-patch-repair endonuclease
MAFLDHLRARGGGEDQGDQGSETTHALFNAATGANLPQTARLTTRDRREPCEIRVAKHHLSRKVRLATRAELMEAGVSADAIRHAVRAGRLFRIHPGVYATIPPEQLGTEDFEEAALLAVGSDAVLGHGTAAFRQELIVAPPMSIHVVTAREVAAPRGVEVHRCTTLRPEDVVGRITSVPRTLLDLAATYGRRPLLQALAEAEFHHAITPADILATLRRGHPGSAKLRAALHQHVPGHGEMRSKLERRFRRLLIEAHLPLPLRNQRIGPYLVDCLWPGARLIAELDGGQHERPHQRAIDAERDLDLRSRGYLPLRYSWRQIRDQGSAVTDELRAVLGR